MRYRIEAYTEGNLDTVDMPEVCKDIEARSWSGAFQHVAYFHLDEDIRRVEIVQIEEG